MMLSWKPKPGSLIGKPGFVQKMGEPGPPEFDMKEHLQSGLEAAAARLLSGIQANDAKAVVMSLRNILALLESEETESEE
jgi:hypothetical protein